DASQWRSQIHEALRNASRGWFEFVNPNRRSPRLRLGVSGLWRWRQVSANPSASGRKRTLAKVRYRPQADIRVRLLDHLVRAQEQVPRNREAERLGGLHVDDKLELGRLFDRQISRLRAFEDLVDIGCRVAEQRGAVGGV